MRIIFTNEQYAANLVTIARDQDTVYGWGAIGSPASYGNNRSRYNVPYAPDGSFIFDCSGFVYKAIPLGWYGDQKRVYGGADPAKNPELYNCNDILSMCSDVSSDFSNIMVGEVLYMKGATCGHVGLYIGNGQAVECTTDFTGGCVITEVKNCGIDTGIPYKRTWLKHGKLPFLNYIEPAPVPDTDKQAQIDKINEIRKNLDELEAML